MSETNPPPKPAAGLKTSLPSAHAASSSLMATPEARPQLSEQQKKQYLNKPGTEPRHLAIALHHAHQIQTQKDTEALILDRILEFVSFPSSSTADPASPSPDDASAFKAALLPFQPTDYDNLIQERNIEGLCGYTLCPREHRKEDPKASYRIVWGAKGSGPGGRGREMNIVPKEKLEMWCSDECAERAMYIRVQLAEDPVWERRADDTRAQSMLLLEEARAAKQGKGKSRCSSTVGQLASELDNMHMDNPVESTDIADDVKRLNIGDDRARAGALALERGDSSPVSRAGRVDVTIRENEHVSHDGVKSPKPREGDREGGSIEGYVPKERRDARGSDDDDDDDKEDILNL